jgi:hypothetical protein
MNENTKMKVEESVLTLGVICYLSVNILIWCYFLGVL